MWVVTLFEKALRYRSKSLILAPSRKNPKVLRWQRPDKPIVVSKPIKAGGFEEPSLSDSPLKRKSKKDYNVVKRSDAKKVAKIIETVSGVTDGIFMPPNDVEIYEDGIAVRLDGLTASDLETMQTLATAQEFDEDTLKDANALWRLYRQKMTLNHALIGYLLGLDGYEYDSEIISESKGLRFGWGGVLQGSGGAPIGWFVACQVFDKLPRATKVFLSSLWRRSNQMTYSAPLEEAILANKGLKSLKDYVKVAQKVIGGKEKVSIEELASFLYEGIRNFRRQHNIEGEFRFEDLQFWKKHKELVEAVRLLNNLKALESDEKPAIITDLNAADYADDLESWAMHHYNRRQNREKELSDTVIQWLQELKMTGLPPTEIKELYSAYEETLRMPIQLDERVASKVAEIEDEGVRKRLERVLRSRTLNAILNRDADAFDDAFIAYCYRLAAMSLAHTLSGGG